MMRLQWTDKRPVPERPETILTSLTERETDVLRRLAEGNRCLEIGAAYGYSAVVMATAPATHVISIDPHTWIADSATVMASNLERYGVTDRVRVLRGMSWDVIPLLAADGERFGLIFIDGDHSFQAVTRDVRLALTVLDPQIGVLVCHDYDEETCAGVRAALDAWLRPPRLFDTMAIYLPGEWNRARP